MVLMVSTRLIFVNKSTVLSLLLFKIWVHVLSIVVFLFPFPSSFVLWPFCLSLSIS